MRKSFINVEKSIEKGWLVKPKDWFNKIDHASFYMFPIAGTLYSTILIFQTKHPNTNEKPIVFFICPFIILLSLYSAYRKAFQNKLTTIETGLTNFKSKEILLEFINTQNYNKVTKYADVIIVNEELSFSFNGSRTKTITFLITNNKILFNIVKETPKISPPVLFQHLFLKKQIRKFFEKSKEHS